MRNIVLIAALVFGAFAPAGAQTSSTTPVSSAAPQSHSEIEHTRIDTMFSSGHADASWFTDSFLAQVPASKIDEIIGQLKTGLGDYKNTDGKDGDFIAHFAKGTNEVLIHLDGANKIDSMWFKGAKIQAASLVDALKGFNSLSGAVSYVVREGDAEKAALDASQPMAVGSAFKLAVLAGLRDEIARKQHTWSEVVPLNAGWKTFPSGVIRTWPDGTPLTIATYATQMISISDNTAADTLVHVVGPSGLAPYAMGNAPFLTTRC